MSKDEWVAMGTANPKDGELCEVKMMAIVRAYYKDVGKEGEWRTPDVEQNLSPQAVGWRSIKEMEATEDKTNAASNNLPLREVPS